MATKNKELVDSVLTFAKCLMLKNYPMFLMQCMKMCENTKLDDRSITNKNITNKIMQGHVMDPLMSSNSAYVNILKSAVNSGNIYMYKDKVPIPPLIMQDDTLTKRACGIKTQSMNTMINPCSNVMELQFGSDKCVKLHTGKNHNS